MTIQEAKQAQAALDAAIAEMLNSFSVETGLTVVDLRLDIMPRIKSPTRYVVTAEVKL